MDSSARAKLREVYLRAQRTVDWYEILQASGMPGDERDQFERLMAQSVVDDLRREGVSDD